jgi:hypothetical protein
MKGAFQLVIMIVLIDMTLLFTSSFALARGWHLMNDLLQIVLCLRMQPNPRNESSSSAHRGGFPFGLTTHPHPFRPHLVPPSKG